MRIESTHAYSAIFPTGPNYEACSCIKVSNLFLQNWRWTPYADLLLPCISYALPFWQHSRPLHAKYRICAEFNIVAITMLRRPEPPKVRVQPTTLHITELAPFDQVHSTAASTNSTFHVAQSCRHNMTARQSVCAEKNEGWSSPAFLISVHLVVDLTIDQAFAIFPRFPTISVVDQRGADRYILQSMSSPEFF